MPKKMIEYEDVCKISGLGLEITFVGCGITITDELNGVSLRIESAGTNGITVRHAKLGECGSEKRTGHEKVFGSVGDARENECVLFSNRNPRNMPEHKWRWREIF